VGIGLYKLRLLEFELRDIKDDRFSALAGSELKFREGRQGVEAVWKLGEILRNDRQRAHGLFS
jgi:hypothetical protein